VLTLACPPARVARDVEQVGIIPFRGRDAT